MASLDEAYLDFSGTERLYPVSLLPVAEQIRDDIRRNTGLDASIGIGPNRMIAKLASDFAKPRGLMEIRPGWEEGFVAGLELRALPGIGPKTAARLARLGLTQAAQVQAMSEESLVRLIGDGARELKWRAHGHGSAVLRPDRLPRSVSREATLARDTTDLAYLQRLLALFVGRVAGELRAQGLVARAVVLKLRQADFRTVTRRRTLPRATDLDAELLGPARALLEAAFADSSRRGQAVRLLGLAATGLDDAAPAELFEPPQRARLRDLAAAVDRVRQKYGSDAVTPAALLSLERRGARP